MPNFPNSLDALANPGPTTWADDAGFELDVQVSTLNDIAEQVEAQLGYHASPATIAALMTRQGTGAGQAKWGYSNLAKLGTASGAGATLDINGFDTNFGALLGVWKGRSDVAAAAASALLRLNNDATGVYDWQIQYGAGTTNTAAEGLAGTSASLGAMPALSAGVSSPGYGMFLIPFYRSALHKGILSIFGYATNTTTGTIFSGHVHARWKATASITRVTVLPSAGSWTSDSELTLYGLPL